MYTPYEENGELKTYKEVKISVDRQHYVLKRMLVEGVIDKRNTATLNVIISMTIYLQNRN